jgi:hypothetical protein
MLRLKMRSLRRAVDHESEVLESFVNKRRDKKAALKQLGAITKRKAGAGAASSAVSIRNRAGGSLPPCSESMRDNNATDCREIEIGSLPKAPLPSPAA